MARPQILFLSHLLPYPPDSGAAIRTFNTIRQLATDFAITGLCFYRQDPAAESMSLAERLAHLSNWGSWQAVRIPQDERRLRLLWDHMRSVVGGRPYTWYMHDSVRFADELRQALRQPLVLAHLDSLDLVRYAPLASKLPLICTHHNVESSLLRRRADGGTNPIMGAYLKHQAALLEREERAWLPRMRLNIAVSPDDQAELARLAPSARITTVPNGVDTTYFAPSDGEVRGAVFVGGTNWFPNRDALEWFVASVLPVLREKGFEHPVNWVGFISPEERRRYQGIPGLTLTGYVSDVRPYIAEAACFVVPLRVGGGTRLKVLDAWSSGKAVVSTTIGCEGLATKPGENILVADTPGAIADAVMAICRDSELRRRLGREARRTVEEQYSWDVIGEVLRSQYRDIIGQPSSELSPVSPSV